MKRAMVDLETFGSNPNACIVQIGACYFSLESKEYRPFLKINVNANNSLKHGATIDADTIYWWLQQSDKARESIYELPKERYDERLALVELNEFLDQADEIWSHSTFDFVIIMNRMKHHDIKPSFSFKDSRDIRTLTELAKQKLKGDIVFPTRTGTHHDALDDATYQCRYVSDLLRILI